MAFPTADCQDEEIENAAEMEGIGRSLSWIFKGLVEGFEAGTEEGVRIGVEKMKEDESVLEEVAHERRGAWNKRRMVEDEENTERRRTEEERRKERDEERTFWMTPGARPLAEPPILDWDWFFRRYIPSDLRYQMLFRNDPEKRCRMKDIIGEQAALAEYSTSLTAMRDDTGASAEGREFYENLVCNVYGDYKDVNEEFRGMWHTATKLSCFEFKYLDDDGRTTRLEEWIEKGADIFYTRHPKIREKYQYLVPADFVEDRLPTYEFYHLDIGGGTLWMEKNMRDGNDALKGWPQEVQDKYGHLRRFLPIPPSHRPENHKPL